MQGMCVNSFVLIHDCADLAQDSTEEEHIDNLSSPTKT